MLAEEARGVDEVPVLREDIVRHEAVDDLGLGGHQFQFEEHQLQRYFRLPLLYVLKQGAVLGLAGVRREYEGGIGDRLDEFLDDGFILADRIEQQPRGQGFVIDLASIFLGESLRAG